MHPCAHRCQGPIQDFGQGAVEFLTPGGGGPEHKICSKRGFPVKLPVLEKKSWGQGGPRPPGPLDPLVDVNAACFGKCKK